MSRFAPAAALAALVLCAYFPATKAGYVWDDDAHFIEDELMTAPDGLRRIWFDPGPAAWNYWPLSRTSFWIERRIWGVNAAASHTVNILLHLAAVLTFFCGLRRFGVPNAWFIGALFAVHPIFVESVTWITERTNVLSGVFYLLCIGSFLRFDENREWCSYAGALLLFVCSLLSKSTTVMLPVMLTITATSVSASRGSTKQ